MRELVQYAFDFFAYVIPGLFVIFSISLLVVPINSINDATTLTTDFNSGVATVLVIIAYVIGFIIYPIGRMIYKTLGFRIFGYWLKDDSNKNNLSVPTKYALIRELSPTNFKYVESWNIYCAMAHNLMVASLIFTIVAIIKIILTGNALIWTGLAILGFAIFLVLTHRAVTYFHWAAYDINASIEGLNLDKKAEEY